MTNILKDLYYGNISPLSEHITEPGYHKLTGEVVELEETLINKLSAENQKTFNKFCDVFSQICGAESFCSFKSGFKLGASIMLEVLSKD